MSKRRVQVQEEEPLFGNKKPEQHTEQWDSFKDLEKKEDSGSTAQSQFFPRLEVWTKLVVYVITFALILAAAVISKGSLLFMTSQLSSTTRPYCNRDKGRNKQFVVTLPRIERTAWIWLLFFAYLVPQAGTLLRSCRMCLFKGLKLPTLSGFMLTLLTETLPTIGTAILVFHVLPEMDVIKGAMLTNAVCFVPAAVGFFCRKRKCPSNIMILTMDVLSLTAQASAFVVWPMLEDNRALWLIPVAVILISFGYWENYITEDAPFQAIRKLAASYEFTNDKYFTYIFVSIWKSVVYFLSMLLIIYGREGEMSFLFDDFRNAFQDHGIYINEIAPIISSANTPNIPELISTSKGTTIIADHLVPVWVWLINVCCTYAVYVIGKFACKVMIQDFSFAFPLNLVMPVTISALIAVSGAFVRDECAFASVIPYYLFFNVPPIYFLKDFLGSQHAWIWLIWLLSQAWVTAHTWTTKCERQARTERLFVRPMYDAVLVDQDVAMKRRRSDRSIRDEDNLREEYATALGDQEIVNARTPIIYACGTMWHETREEMLEFLKSVMRMDIDQCARRVARSYMNATVDDYYEIETHIFFDDAFFRYKDDKQQLPYLNEHVKTLIKCVDESVEKIHGSGLKLYPPMKYPTPYGGRLVWTLPGQNKLIAHLKDKAKIRAKKRWSQVMYMYYLLGYNLMENNKMSTVLRDLRSRNTFILALDGDIDFQPQAVLLLVDLMKRNAAVGAACGRIHPIGSGPMVWYQMFEYAVGHWLQKATEHMIGCVLCSPGCFSLFRGSALMDYNVMKKYTTTSTEARHYVQYDQGEDRWLCTLLLQRGYRVEYSAASDAFTHCPESFNEFYTQRRRWMPSTTANIMELLTDYRNVVKENPNISRLYIAYQVILMVGTILGPGTIFLMLVGAFVAAFQMDQWTSFLWNVVPILFFMLICKIFEKDKVQLFFAAVISAIYGLVMMAVLVGVMLQIANDGPLAPSSLFFFCVAGEMIVTGLLHPKEVNCLPYGIIYYVTVPSMYMLLVIYTIFNMNNVSWGTREITLVPSKKPEDEEPMTEEEKRAKEEKKRVEKELEAAEKKNKPNVFMKWWTKLFLSREKASLLEIQKTMMEISERLDRISKGIPENPGPEERKTQTVDIMHGIEGVVTKAKVYVDDTESLAMEMDDENWIDDEVLDKCQTGMIPQAEKVFWKKLLERYLKPEDNRSEEVEQNLRNLRDMSVSAFFMLNALFVLVVFLLTLKKELLHIKWPFDIKTNFTYFENNEVIMVKQYLQLEPIGLVFLVFFAILLVVQFIAMLFHRFSTFCQILANTKISFAKEEVDIPDMIKKIRNGTDEDESYEPAGRRKTVVNATANQKKGKPGVINMEEIIVRRMTHVRMNLDDGKRMNLTKEEKKAIHKMTTMDARRTTIVAKGGFQQHFENLGSTTEEGGGRRNRVPEGIANLGFEPDTTNV